MSHRFIKDLEWARLSEKGPELPLRRPRGAKAAGLRYERNLAKALPEARHGLWFEFMDSSGHGWCQPDLVTSYGASLVVLEVKYSWVPEAHSQLEQLYLPVLEKALGHRPIGVVVCRRLIPGIPVSIEISSSFDEACEAARSGNRSIWQWLGGMPLSWKRKTVVERMEAIGRF